MSNGKMRYPYHDPESVRPSDSIRKDKKTDSGTDTGNQVVRVVVLEHDDTLTDYIRLLTLSIFKIPNADYFRKINFLWTRKRAGTRSVRRFFRRAEKIRHKV